MRIFNFVIGILFLAGLFGCGSSIDDTWPGIGELSIETPGTRSVEGTFRLSSNLILSGLTPDVSYSLTSKCYRRPQLAQEPSYIQGVYEKTLNYEASEQIKNDVPVINHLSELVLIYPDFFERCDFEIKAKNAVGSTDSSVLTDVRFEYYEDDHDLKLDNSEVEENYRELLFERRSILKALYDGDIEREQSLTGPTIPARNTSDSRVSEAKIVCSTDTLKQTPVNNIIDIRNNDIETLTFYDLPQLHDVTINHPVENCIFSATDINGKQITSKSFDLIRNLDTYDNEFVLDDIEILQNITKNLIDYTSYFSQEVPHLPETLLLVQYHNTSSEEKMIHLGSEYGFSTDDVFLFKRSRVPNIPEDEIAFENGCNGNSPVYTHVYHGFERQPLASIFRWYSDHIEQIGGLTFLRIPPQTSGSLTLELNINDQEFEGLDVSEYHGLVIAPDKRKDFLNLAFTSPNKFKLNIIQNHDVNSIFYPGERLSSLPLGFRNYADQALSENAAFGIVMMNRHQIQSGGIIVRSNRNMTPIIDCMRNNTPSTTYEDGIITTTIPR